MTLFCMLVCFLASVIGAICGIGGGVIIKPVLDACRLADIKTINFLSGCTVLSMSVYSVIRNFYSKKTDIEVKTVIPLASGAAIGGVTGKLIFSKLVAALPTDSVSVGQSVFLMLLTSGTLLYTLRREKIKTHNISGTIVSALVGLSLGMISSFLGIGGGPINLVVLSFLYSMGTKKAASNSLFIIMLSQTASLLYTLLSGSAPTVSLLLLFGMSVCGILGGIIGRKCNASLSSASVNKLFAGCNIMIIMICLYNIIQKKI